MPRKLYYWKLNNRELALGQRTLIAGVLNLTPDSFHDGGRYQDPDAAYARALELEEQGAGIIDIGAESTRPGSARITAAIELQRLVPVLKRLRDKLRIPISVDTYKAEVAERALELGAEIINDPSGLTFDPGVAKVVVQHNAGVILNHMRGRPESWGRLPPLPDVMGTIVKELEATVSRARRGGVDKLRIVVDPGLGFGKRKAQNSEILARLSELAQLDLPIQTHLAETRRGFETTPGATMITAAKPAPRPQPVVVPPPAAVPIAAAAPPAAPRALPSEVTARVRTPAKSPTASSPHPSPHAGRIAAKIAAPPKPAVPAPSPTAPARVAPPQIAAAPPAPARHPAPPAPAVESRWHRALGQLSTGLAALALPVSVGRLLGIISVGGGRNLWAFVDLDTIAFDLVLLFVIWYCGRHALTRRWPTPLFVMVAIVVAATTLTMAYAVTNFGTLFRLREMVYVLTALLPVTLAPAISATRSIRQERSRTGAPAPVE